MTHTKSSHFGEGVGSKVQTPRHWYKAWGRWWISEEEFQKYREKQVQAKRARKAGYDYTQVDEFLEFEKHVIDAVQSTRKRDKVVLRELRKLREKYDLPANTNRMHLKALYARTKDPEIASFLHLQERLTTTDAEKLARIRRIFLSGGNPYDMLTQTALIVGINLRKK